MESFIALLTTVLAVHLLAVISPGPDFLIVLQNSVSRSRKEGIITALGVALGIGVHVIYCVAGLALIISQSIIAFNIIKILGALYLLFIGVKVFIPQKKARAQKVEKKLKIDTRGSFIQGFITNVLNPKATLFFLSLFTFVITPDVPKLWLSFFGVFMIINTFFWFAIVACVFTFEPVRKVYVRFAKAIDYVCGALFIALGLKLLFTRR